MSRPGAESFAAAREEAAERVLERLRRLVRSSARTQRSIELDNGFQRGYLSQVLKGHIALTVRHLLGILRALEVAPSTFFAELEEGIDLGFGRPPVLLEIRQRMARYDAAIEQLEEKGLLDPTDGEATPDEA